MDWQAFWNSILTWLRTAGLRLVIALIILFASFKVINFIAKRLYRNAEKKNLDKTISRTLIYIFKLGSKIVIAICMVGYVGIDTSGLTALVTSLGVCAGLAVNGALANLAGGVMLILTRPFKIDDFIEACGYKGTVEEIHITQTKIITPDNKVVYIPNGTLSSSEIVNYSEKPFRRVDIDFTIAKSADFEKAKALVLEVVKEDEFLLVDPEPIVRVGKHTKNGIEVYARIWTNSGTYWDAHFALHEKVKAAFDKNGIEMPNEKVDVNINK